MFELTNLLMELHERGIDTKITVDIDGKEVVSLTNMKDSAHLVTASGETTEQAFAEIVRKLGVKDTKSFQDDRLSIL